MPHTRAEMLRAQPVACFFVRTSSTQLQARAPIAAQPATSSPQPTPRAAQLAPPAVQKRDGTCQTENAAATLPASIPPSQHATVRILPFLLSLAVALFVTPTAARADCTVWSIERNGHQIHLQSSPLASGRTEVLVPDGKSLVSVIVVQGEGQSSDLVIPAAAVRIITRCQGDTLRILAQRGSQPQREVMSMRMSALAALRLTVHVTGADGAKARFRLDGWTTATREDGPVIDLFQGRVPLGTDGHAITTVVEAAAAGGAAASLSGTAEVRFTQGYPMLVVESGRRWRAVLDLAAAVTVVRRDALPKEVAVRAATMRQSSSQGTELLSLSAQGAGGAVTGFGTATLPRLQFGTVRLDQAEVLALDALPAVGGAPLDAIIGLDVLRQAGRARLTRGSGSAWTLALGRDISARGAAPDAVLPLRRVGALVGIDARLGDTDVFLVLDSGSPRSFISEGAARAAHLATTPSTGKAPRGLDGKPLPVGNARADHLSIGAVALSDVALLVSDLPVLAKLATTNVGLLGSDLLQRFSAIEVDFSDEVLRLWR